MIDRDNLNKVLTTQLLYISNKNFYKNDSTIFDKSITNRSFYVCVFSNGSISACNLMNMDMSSNSFFSMMFENCVITSINFTKSEFIECTFKNVVFVDCFFRKTEFDNTSFINCVFKKSSLQSSFLTSCELLNSSLETVDFSLANITDLKTSDLKISDLVLQSKVYIWDKDLDCMLDDPTYTTIDDINTLKKFLNNI